MAAHSLAQQRTAKDKCHQDQVIEFSIHELGAQRHPQSLVTALNKSFCPSNLQSTSFVMVRPQDQHCHCELKVVVSNLLINQAHKLKYLVLTHHPAPLNPLVIDGRVRTLLVVHP